MVDETVQTNGSATDNYIFMSEATDAIIIPRKYQSYAQKKREENKLNKIILIQRNFRKYLLRQFIRRCAAEYRRIRCSQEEWEVRAKDATKKRKDCIVRPNEFPCSKEDFESLYAEVQKWKDAEMKRICQSYSDGPKIVEVSLLLDKEIGKLNDIERKKNAVLNALQDYRQEKLLTEMGEPVKWVGYKGEYPLHSLTNMRLRHNMVICVFCVIF
ncbi:IQUB.2 family protein [Megaselia abdita]